MGTPSGKLVGRYEIVGEIGRGAMGAVFKAWDPKIERFVAIKTILLRQNGLSDETDFRRRFFVEAQAAGRLLHPGIVTVFDVGEDPETTDPYIVMEYIEGANLGELLARNTTGLPLEMTLQITQDVAEALDYAHGQGVVHRDIKPANILIPKEGQAKIGDFGIAQLDVSHVTLPGVVMGTPAYMSPEQLEGTPVDGRSDLFSLGVILYTALTGFNPFQGNSPASVCFKVANRQPLQATALVPELPPELDGIIARALAKDPAGRYQRGADFASAVAELRDKVAAPRKSALWFSAPPGGRTWLDGSKSANGGPGIANKGGGAASAVAALGSSGGPTPGDAPSYRGASLGRSALAGGSAKRGFFSRLPKWDFARSNTPRPATDRMSGSGSVSSTAKRVVAAFASSPFQTGTALALFGAAILLGVIEWKNYRTPVAAPRAVIEQVEQESLADSAAGKPSLPAKATNATRLQGQSRIVSTVQANPARAMGKVAEPDRAPEVVRSTTMNSTPPTRVVPSTAAPISPLENRADLKVVAMEGARTASSSGTMAAASKTAPSSGALAAVTKTASLGAIPATGALPTAPDSNLEIRIANHFPDAMLSVWVDGNLAHEQGLRDGHKKWLMVLGGGVKETIKIALPSGKHDVRVKVRSAAEQYDETKTIDGEFPKGGQKMLSINFEKHTRQMVMSFADDQAATQP